MTEGTYHAGTFFDCMEVWIGVSHTPTWIGVVWEADRSLHLVEEAH